MNGGGGGLPDTPTIVSALALDTPVEADVGEKKQQ